MTKCLDKKSQMWLKSKNSDIETF